MNREEVLLAFEKLAAAPASKWIGNRVVGGSWLQKCTRCGVEETCELPSNVLSPEDVPAGLNEQLLAWKRAFQTAHERCAENSPENSSVDNIGGEERSTTRGLPAVTMKRVLSCAKHGARRWKGHVMCDACGRIYQTLDERGPGYATEICRCGHHLLPPAAERVGDVLGLRTGGIVVDEEGRRYLTPEAQDWTARPICYLCHRYFAKHGGRVPVEQGRD